MGDLWRRSASGIRFEQPSTGDRVRRETRSGPSALDPEPQEPTTGRSTDRLRRGTRRRSDGRRSQVNPDERTDRTPPEDLRRLLSELVRRVERGTDPTTAREDVILDTDVEGVRCIFIRQPEADADHAIQLSPREREIVRMVAAGYPNKTIAAVLDISSWTVGTHLRHVFAKLGVSSRAAMVSRLHAIGRIGPLDRA